MGWLSCPGPAVDAPPEESYCVAVANVTRSFALASIGGVVTVVQGYGARFLGWTLGPVETLNSVIGVGFSVDMVVHLAHRYTHSDGKTSDARARHALGSMGPAVVGGCLSTLGVTLLMLASPVRAGGGRLYCHTFRRWPYHRTLTLWSPCPAVLDWRVTSVACQSLP